MHAALFGSFLLSLIGGWSAGDDLPKSFDVASVKACAEESFAYRRLPGGGLYSTGLPLKYLMILAYDVQRFQFSGGPKWIDEDCWTIQAKAEGVQGTLSIVQMAPLLRSLIEERFQLKVHRETRQMPVFALVAGKSGPKLKPHRGSTTDRWMRTLPGGWEMNNVDMTYLANRLSRQLGRMVIDRTGIQGRHDISLDFELREQSAGDPALPPNTPSRPSIFTAIQEQLGLKLESSKGPVEILVIDHVEKPSAN